ncbi:MAG: nicotinate-nicotinamide nucleotide adenylyltransferase [Bryobacterales bacterium]|nr:nicotinate-nicotinamide nucleotide adenylyltransferase [Bryobacterales bacterium]
MRFLRKAPLSPRRLGILSGAFHPPTRAHLALAQSALDSFQTDEVLFVMPETLPHKLYEHVTLRQRLEMLSAAAPGPRFSIAVAEGGLFLEIARECRAFYTTDTRLRFICGRDTAERVIAWNYSRHPPIEAQLEEFELLVAPRQGPFSPPIHLASAIAHLPVDESFDDVSSTEVRRRIAAGEDWTHLVPPAILPLVADWYPVPPLPR